MQTERTDPRVERSRSALVRALAKLLEGRSLSSISVSEICRHAGVDRATFYRHFEDREDLLERGVRLAVDAIIERIGAADPRDPRFDTRLGNLFAEIADRRDFYRPFAGANADGRLGRVLADRVSEFLLRERIAPVLREGAGAGSVDRSEMVTAMTVSALVGLIGRWLTDSPHWRAEDVHAAYAAYVIGGVTAFAQSNASG